MFRSIAMPSFPYILNKNLSDYCKNTVNESIRKLTDKYKSKKYISNIKMNYNDEDDNFEKPEFNLYFLLVFLSISSMTWFFYKRIKE